MATWPVLTRTPEDVMLAAQAACVFEVCAAKPGNVQRSAGFTDTHFEDFLLSAAAIGPAFAAVGRLGVGQIVWQAVTATRRLVQTNTNLGLVLLLAPLAKACLVQGGVRGNLERLLADLTVEDTRWVYAAIRAAQPSGLGEVPEADIRAEAPTITLRDAMALSRERDSIAAEYVSGFAVTFDLGLPALREASQVVARPNEVIVQAFLTILAQVPDTLIARKRGPEISREVSQRAAAVLGRGGVLTPPGREALADFDRSLRDERHTLNPGTTADLVAAAIFLHLLREDRSF